MSAAEVCADWSGTPYGFRLHLRHKTRPCDPCRLAKNVRAKELRHAHRDAQRAEDAASLARLMDSTRPAARRPG